MNTKTYLKIGAIVQTLVIVLRLALGKTQKVWKNIDKKFYRNPIFWVSFTIATIVGLIINIVSWPIGIVAEIHNTIKKI